MTRCAAVARPNYRLRVRRAGKTFRDDWYPLQGQPLADDRRHAQPDRSTFTRWCACGWPVLALPEVEADDVIGPRWRARPPNQQIEVIVSSGDKDMSQLVART